MPTLPAGVIGLFAGIGCVARRFARTDAFEPLALVDVRAEASDTYLHNFPEANYRLRDVSELTDGDFRELAGGWPIAGVVVC